MVKASNQLSTACICLIGLFILVRLMSLGFYPLYDTTEARYSEIARIMLETRNWITPQFDYNVPFWGKPPLYAWLSAMSFAVFGVSEFSARLPHFFIGLVSVLLVWQFARQVWDRQKAIFSCLVLVSSIGFIVSIGMVMTDAALLCAITLAMTSYWQAYSKQNKLFYGHIFFIALAIGMLAKGPVAIVIVGIPLVLWSVLQGQFISALKVLPWLSGMLVFLAISAPWYIMAEAATPGFLEYFLWGEHIQRFLVSGWQGDLYGTAHDETKGTIWLFWLAAAFPWSLILIWRGYQWGFASKDSKKSDNNLNHYLLIWMMSPMLLFTFAGNILPAYVLPGFSAMALLCGNNLKINPSVLRWAGASLLLLVCTLVAFGGGFTSKSAESELLVEHSQKLKNTPLFYWQSRPFSAQFYSKGQAQLLSKTQKLNYLFQQPVPFYLAVKHSDLASLTVPVAKLCQVEQQTSKRLLLHCNTLKGSENENIISRR